jgi:hypothetical protein
MVKVLNIIFAVVRSVFELSQKESSMSLKVASTVNMTSMYCLHHAVESVVSNILQLLDSLYVTVGHNTYNPHLKFKIC